MEKLRRSLEKGKANRKKMERENFRRLYRAKSTIERRPLLNGKTKNNKQKSPSIRGLFLLYAFGVWTTILAHNKFCQCRVWILNIDRIL